MNPDAWISELSKQIKSQILINEPMNRHTSWKVGGLAQALIELESLEDLRIIDYYVKKNNLELLIMGAGTNLLVLDKGIKGIVIKFGTKFSKVVQEEEEIVVQAGAKLTQVIKASIDAGLGGFEFMAGIPGTLGGAVVMNAGANGSSVSEVLQRVVLMNENGFIEEKEAFDLDFAYRSSKLLHSKNIVLEATFKGSSGDARFIAEKIKENILKRKAIQPLGYPNAGSVFKNPEGDYAGRLIELAQCKGLQVGEAKVSEKHANFIINIGKATSEDILRLIELVQKRVYEKFQVELLTEIQIAGNH